MTCIVWIFAKKYFHNKIVESQKVFLHIIPDGHSQVRMERRPRGLLLAQLQSMGLVEPLEGEAFLLLDSN